MNTFLRQRRTLLQMSQAQLAESLGVSQQTVARWETNGQIPAKYIKDLAILTGARAQDFLPGLSESSTRQISPHTKAVPQRDQDSGSEEEDLPFGDVCFQFANDSGRGTKIYPITWGTLNHIQMELGDAGVGSRHTASWIQFETLNNKWVAVNTRNVDRVSLVDDNAEAMTDYWHDEVYKAAIDLFDRVPSEKELAQIDCPYSKDLVVKVQELMHTMGERAIHELLGFTVQFVSGQTLSMPLNTEVVESLDYVFGSDGAVYSQPLGFLQLDCRGDGRFENVRLDGVRFIEASLAVFHSKFDE